MSQILKQHQLPFHLLRLFRIIGIAFLLWLPFIFKNFTFRNQSDSRRKLADLDRLDEHHITSVTNPPVLNSSICELFHSDIYLGAHHKTGTMLLLYQLSQRVIASYVKRQCPHNKVHHLFHTHYHLDAVAINQWLKYHQTSRQLIILNIIRNPLDTILSAYNYHRRGPELWTRVSLHTIPSLKCKYQEQRENQCSSNLFIQRTESMNISSNISIQTLYTEILNVSQGIDFEFDRYHNCCFEEIYSSFKRIEELKQLMNGRNAYFENLRLEDFTTDFESACNHLLDALGILQKGHRDSLLMEMKRFDLNAVSERKRNRKKHVMNGKYDKEQQMKILLESQERRDILKNKTSMLQYVWNWTE